MGILPMQHAGNVKMLEATDFSEEMIKQAKRKCQKTAGCKPCRFYVDVKFYRLALVRLTDYNKEYFST